MALRTQLADLFHRDLTRLLQQVEAFPDDNLLWQCAPGVTNSAGNLVLHLEGNLREFIGRQIGSIAYRREREVEFGARGLTRVELAARVQAVRDLVPRVLREMTTEQLDAVDAQRPPGLPPATQQFLLHLYGHFSYHLGQIDYLRRLLTEGQAVRYANLP